MSSTSVAGGIDAERRDQDGAATLGQNAETSLSVDVRVDVAPEAVWNVIADLGAIQTYHPAVQKSYYHSPERSGVGVARVCEFWGGRSVEEHAIEWNEGEGFALELRNGKGMPPFRRAVGRMSVTGESSGSRVTLDFDYDLRFGLLGKLMDRLMVRGQFERMLPGVLQGLKRQLETGTA